MKKVVGVVVGWLLGAVALLPLAAGADVRVIGEARYLRPDGLWYPIRHGRIEIMNKNTVSSDQFFGFATTDGTGRFDFSFAQRPDLMPFESGVADLYFRVLPQTNGTPVAIGNSGISGVANSMPTDRARYNVSGVFWDADNTTINLGVVELEDSLAGFDSAGIENSFTHFQNFLSAIERMSAIGIDIHPRPYNFQHVSSGSTTYGEYLNLVLEGWGTTVFSDRDINTPTTYDRAVAYQWLRDEYRKRNLDPFAPFPTMSDDINPGFAVNDREGYIQGFMMWAAGRSSNTTTINYRRPTSTVTIALELNYDGFGAPNGNSDALSDVAGQTGFAVPAAVGSMFYDLVDTSSTVSDQFDISEIPVNLITDTIRNSPTVIWTMQDWFDRYDAQNTGYEPQVWGTAQIHGMTQNRFTRPTIGLIQHIPTPATWYFDGVAGSLIDVRNFGSQPFSNFLDFSGVTEGVESIIFSPTGTTHPTLKMLGTSANATPISAGAIRSFSFSVPRFWTGTTQPEGYFTMNARFVDSSGARRLLEPATPAIFNPRGIDPLVDSSSPVVTVTDPGEYRSDRTSLLIRTTATDPESAIIRYEVGLGTTPGSANIATWQVQTTSATSVNTVFTGLTVPRGTTVYATSRVFNGAGRFGLASSDGIRLGDTTSPFSVTVTDAGNFQTDRTTVNFSTSAREDSALVRLEYCISSNPTFAGDLVPWTTHTIWSENPNQRNLTVNVSRSGLTLPDSQRYYVGVRWTNADGTSTQVLSDGVWVINGPHVYGTVDLDGLFSSSDRQFFPVTFTLSGAATDTRVINVGTSGAYAIPVTVTTGTINVSAKASHWLRKKDVVSNIGGRFVRNLTLLNGDVDGDNEVTIFDYIELSSAFGTDSEDPGYSVNADLDYDGSVTIFDYILLSENFDLVGDAP